MTENAGSTAVVAPNCGAESKIMLTPRTAAAATEFGAGTWHIASIGQGTFTVNHVNSATANRTFDYSIQG